jgi:hypothetical protein
MSQDQATTPTEFSEKGILEAQREEKNAENKVGDPRDQRQSTPSQYFEVDTTLQRQSRIGRGTRHAEEEFGYATLVSEQEPQVMGEIYSCTTLVGASHSHIAASDPDTVYFHQAMQQNDAVEFLNAARKEFQSLLDREVIEIIPANLVPTGMRLFLAVWSMKRKRRVKTREVYKHKARLNLDGSQMQPGKDYDLTYAPDATWESIRVLLALVLRHNWKTKQLDYVLAFPQAPVERECYMRIPKGIVINATGVGIASQAQYLRSKTSWSCMERTPRAETNLSCGRL